VSALFESFGRISWFCIRRHLCCAGKATSNGVFDTGFGVLETGTNVFGIVGSKKGKVVPAKAMKVRRSVQVEFYLFRNRGTEWR